MNIQCIKPLLILLAWIGALGATQALAAPTLPALNNPASGQQLPGKFIWFDLASPDLQAQQAFYNSVFGWTFRSPGQSNDAYTLILNQGQPIGGMFSYTPETGEQDGAAWVVLMSAADPDRSMQQVQSLGGSVEIQPTTLSRRGRHALFRDPGGALFGVLNSETGDPPDVQVETGAFFWLDLFTREVDVMTAFYSELAPYESERVEIADGIHRTLLSAHGLPRAGVVPVDEEANRSAWVPYVRVENVEATLEKVIEGGGFAIIPPDPQLHDGNVAVFVDPNGGVTGIVKWEYEQEDGQ